MAVKTYSYAMVPTIKKFNKDLAFITALMGPFGSGKSSGCVLKLVERALTQTPGPDGVRRTRFAVVRNSYPQLRDTTIPTTLEWIGDFGEHRQTDYDFILNKLTAPDGGPVECKFHFRALDRPQDIKNLLSLELTGAWFNEVREIPKRIVDTMRGRVGRYPKMDLEHGFHGASWYGIIMDTNAPDTDHWFYKLFEIDKPHFCPICKDIQGGVILFIDGKCPRCKREDGLPFVSLHRQPSGRGPLAENLPHLQPGYYANLSAGMDKDFIRVYVDGDYGYVSDGKPVYSMFDDDKHVAKEKLKADPRYPIIIGFDNTGRDQAAIICQYMPNGQFRVLHEFIVTDTGTRALVREIVRPFIISNYAGARLILTGDPAGVRKADTDDRDTFQEIYDCFGMEATPARSNALAPRLNSVESLLKKYLGKENYGMLVSPNCPMIIKGFRGEYRMRRLQVMGQERFTDKPEKNLVSHGHDALQYACMAVEDALSLTSRGSFDDYEGKNKRVVPDLNSWDAFT